MSLVHIHLMTNHIPVIGVAIGVVLLSYAMIRRNEDMKKFILGYFVALGLIAIAVYLTGEPAEEAIEDLSGVSKQLIERHESAGTIGLIAIEVMATLSLAAIALRKLALPARKWFFGALLGMSLATAMLMAWVANLGGEIRHPEIGGSPASGVIKHDD